MEQIPSRELMVDTINAINSDRLEVALILLHKNVLTYPGSSFVWKSIGFFMYRVERINESICYLQRAVLLNPKDQESYSNLGIFLKAAGLDDQAENCHRLAISIDGNDPGPRFNLGNLFLTKGENLKALKQYIAAICIAPSVSTYYINYASVLYECANLEEVVQSCRYAIAICPNSVEGLNVISNALRDQDNIQVAIDGYRRIIIIKPDYREGLCNYGVALRDIGDLKGSEKYYRRAISIFPDFIEARSNLLFLISSQGHAADYIKEAGQFGKLVSKKRSHRYTSWRSPSFPMRVGLVSGDFRNHPVGYFIEGLCQSIDPQQIEFIAFPTRVGSDDLTDRLRSTIKAWHPIHGLSDEQAAQQIYQNDVQVLIDLSGHTAHHRLSVFAYKPAPVQCTWLGYWASTGVDEIDFILGDRFLTPYADQGHFSERIYQFPHARFTFTPPDPPVEVKQSTRLIRGAITYGCFNNLNKITDSVIQCWAEILKRVPCSLILIKSSGLSDLGLKKSLLERLEFYGIPRTRVTLEGPSPRESYLLAYNEIDIMLDTFPYTGGTTTCEALWMGVPVLTKSGNCLISRQGESILANAGLHDWVAKDQDEYVLKTVKFSSDKDFLLKLKHGLRANVLSCPIFDSNKFARSFEGMIHDISGCSNESLT